MEQEKALNTFFWVHLHDIFGSIDTAIALKQLKIDKNQWYKIDVVSINNFIYVMVWGLTNMDYLSIQV